MQQESALPLVGHKEELARLEATYANPTIRKKIRTLSLAFPHWRAIRGDGNCFYRALWVGLVEASCKGSAVALAALRRRFHSAEAKLQPPHETDGVGDQVEKDRLWRQVELQFDSLAAHLSQEGDHDDKWARLYEDKETSDLFVCYLRSLTSRSLELHREELEAFLPEGQSFSDRRALAERMGEEAEQLEMSALLGAVEVGVRVYQLDRSEGAFAVYTLPDDSFNGSELLTLLFRPGHYDLLYRRA